MKILMLAWRDLKHPSKGGAEVVTDIYLKGLKKLGHDVTLFTSKYPNSNETDKINDYNIIRKGNKLTVSLYGLLYAKKHEKDFDIIIDQINTLPFLTPVLISKNKRILFSHQLCKNVWFYEMPFPFSYIGYIIELLYLKFYKNTKAFTVSDSSKQDLVKYANIPETKILVLENQIDFKPLKKPLKKENYLVFCGRLTKSKRPEDAIKALYIYLNKINNSDKQSSSSKYSTTTNPTTANKTDNLKLIIIGNGSGKYKNYLKDLVNKLNLKDKVIFTGPISNQERNKIMQKAIAIIVTSVREGWGLIVTEANANGTLAITYNVEGLVDANSNKTGIITKINTPNALAESIDELLKNKHEIANKTKESIKYANSHSNWDKQVRRLEEWMKK